MAKCHCENPYSIANPDLKAVVIRQHEEGNCSQCGTETTFACSDCGGYLCTHSACIGSHDCDKKEVRKYVKAAFQFVVYMSILVRIYVAEIFKRVAEVGGGVQKEIQRKIKEVATRCGYASISTLTAKLKEGRIGKEVQRYKKMIQEALKKRIIEPCAQVLSSITAKVENLRTPKAPREREEIRTSDLPDFSSRRRTNSPSPRETPTPRRSLFALTVIYINVFLKGVNEGSSQSSFGKMEVCPSACLGMPSNPIFIEEGISIWKWIVSVMILIMVTIAIVQYAAKAMIPICPVCKKYFVHAASTDPEWNTMILCSTPGCGALIHRRCQDECNCENFSPGVPGLSFEEREKRPQIPYFGKKVPWKTYVVVFMVLGMVSLGLKGMKMVEPMEKKSEDEEEDAGIFTFMVISTSLLLSILWAPMLLYRIDDTPLLFYIMLKVPVMIIKKMYNVIKYYVPLRVKTAAYVLCYGGQLVCNGRCHVGGWTRNQCVRKCFLPMGHTGNHICMECEETSHNEDLWRLEVREEGLEQELIRCQHEANQQISEKYEKIQSLERDIVKCVSVVAALKDVVDSTTVEQLKKHCERLHIPKTGIKADLIKRVVIANYRLMVNNPNRCGRIELPIEIELENENQFFVVS